ncbi:2-amino-4-deoxychorismate dehydrogenase [Oxobacter pfennigii]|uniref:2-amino-4-deoxychorismate dehydrogenase n=1 Tax=Oxobacter pfennigii TaxID=36849 RepID=A0A0P8WCN9_9CLOT|nr:flavodoxin family protein [Oxobacter pfennigii]KPU45531.1 2-amino-4-deoxychorismate dehydrogenase [Oxobacter pfennigii]
MKVVALNGSPRKKWNTATLLEKALEGAQSVGAETELIHLYDLNFKGCISCFVCKLKNGKSYGKCAMKDDLTPILEKIAHADAVFIGSPIYFGNLTGETRSLLERMLFQYLVYSNKSGPTLFPRQIPIGLIYTMNIPDDMIKKTNFEQQLSQMEGALKRMFGYSECYYSTDTYQFDDYSKYVADRFDVEAKTKRYKEVFPVDCQNVYEMGAKLAKGIPV